MEVCYVRKNAEEIEAFKKACRKIDCVKKEIHAINAARPKKKTTNGSNVPI
ncbi:MAG: hypothetical protein PHW24_01725 [Candidatus Moranbacteria bacterium]|nr:hypothetical protein [Candidatus Moranbacteria bacterium]